MTTPPIFDSTNPNSPLTARHLGSPVLELAVTAANGEEVVLEAYLFLDNSTIAYKVSGPRGERPQFFDTLASALVQYNAERLTILKPRKEDLHA